MNEPTDEQREAWDLAQIKQRPSRYVAKPIASVIQTLMSKRGYGQTQAVEELHRQWAIAAGPALAAVSRPGNLSRGILQVFVRDSSSLQELHLMRRQILQAMQASMPQANIKDIRGRIG